MMLDEGKCTPWAEPMSTARFGPGAIIREGPPSEDVQLLRYFGSVALGMPLDRRRWSRVPAASEPRAWIGWWAGPRRFVSFDARLDNISQGGAKLLSASPPPVHQIVWLCLGIPDPIECVRAKVLEVVPAPGGDSAVRLAFGAPCPENLYRIAVDGLAPRV